jgi:glutathione S-transferase
LSDAELRVWGIGTSRTLRPHWMLCELGLEYETRAIIPRSETMNDPAFRKVSGRGKVPILEHGELMIGESGAIVFYLADRFRERLTLAPLPATTERARFDEMCIFILMELDAPLYVIRRHEGLPEIYGASQTAVDAARAYFSRQTSVIEGWLENAEGSYLTGEHFSAADLLLATCSSWGRFVGIELSQPLSDHLALVTAREGFRKAFERNFTPEALAMLARNAQS